MTAIDPMFRQRLRNAYRDVTVQLGLVERGSRAHFKLEALERAISAAHIELYREAISPQPSVPPPAGEG